MPVLSGLQVAEALIQAGAGYAVQLHLAWSAAGSLREAMSTSRGGPGSTTCATSPRTATTSRPGTPGRGATVIEARNGARVLVVPGSVLLCASLWGFTRLTATSPLAELVVLQTIMMVGLSMMFTPLMTDALGVLPDRLYSHGSAILTTLQQVGGAAGTALFVTVMAKASPSGGAADLPGVHAAFMVAAMISVVTVIGALFTGSRPTPAGGHPTH